MSKYRELPMKLCFGLSLIMLGTSILTACGSAEVNQTGASTISTAIPATNIPDIPSATPPEGLGRIPNPTEALATAETASTRLAQHDQDLQTAVAQSTPIPEAPGPGPMLYTPAPTPTWGTAWFDCGPGRNTTQPQFSNCWQGTINNQRLYLRAGREGQAGDPRQGLLEVDRVDNRGPYPDGIDFYQTPQKVGAVHINGVVDTIVTLVPDDSQVYAIFTFDLATRQWVTPGPSPGPLLPTAPAP